MDFKLNRFLNGSYHLISDLSSLYKKISMVDEGDVSDKTLERSANFERRMRTFLLSVCNNKPLFIVR